MWWHGGSIVSSSSESRSIVSNCLQPRGRYSPWKSPGQKTGVGCFPLLQGIFSTQGSNPGLPHCRWILYQLSHKGSLDLNDTLLWHLWSSAPLSGLVNLPNLCSKILSQDSKIITWIFLPTLIHRNGDINVRKWKSLSHVRLFATQARILKWIAFPFSRGSSQPRDRT